MLKTGFRRTKTFRFVAGAVCAGALAAGIVVGTMQTGIPTAEAANVRPWSFGVIADTQWTVADDGFNPNTVAANIIKQVDQQFISAGVKLVVAVGDTVDLGSKVSIDTRALYAQDLYDAHIGFYPLRGNHEAAEDAAYLDSAPELRYAFPQIGTGVNNKTPSAITTALIPAVDLANNGPAAKRGGSFMVGSNFSEPAALNATNKAVSYSFQYNNATFMLLDQFGANPDVNARYADSTIASQQQWISDTLSSRPANSQAFVLTHKNILGGNHKDNLFGGNIVPADPAAGKDPGDGNGMDTSKLTPAELAALTAKQDAENKFIASMQANKVAAVITGHDHHDFVSVVTSPDGKSKVHQIISASDSSKFYVPTTPISANDAPIRQDLGRVGYYIYTVDGPMVTIDYYADANGGADYGLNGATFDFEKVATLTYSLNGTDTIVAQGASYAGITDNTTHAATTEKGFKGTSMSILAGTNGAGTNPDIFLTNYGRKISNDVTTGWVAAEAGLSSDTLILGGMSRSIGSEKTDEYVLSMSYSASGVATQSRIANGAFGILTKDSDGKWVRAVTKNFGTNHKFVLGPWNSSYKLGACGVDPATKTAWAVLNYNGDFAVGGLRSF